MAHYQKDLQEYQNNVFDQARKKLEEIKPLSDAEKNDKLLNDAGIQNIFNSINVDNKNYEQLQQEVEQYSPNGFEENVILAAGEAGIALVTPRETHQYSATKHTITVGTDFNTTVGNSWLSSVGNKLSLFVQQRIKIFSGKGKIEIKAHSNDIEIIAEKVLKLISTKELIEIASAKGILLTSRGAYIHIKDGDIKLHAPGEIDHKAASHPFNGPTSQSYQFPELKKGKSDLKLLLHDDNLDPVPRAEYHVIFEDGSEVKGLLDENGKAVIENPPSGEAQIFYGYSTDEPVLPETNLFSGHTDKDCDEIHTALKGEFGFDGSLAEMIDSVFGGQSSELEQAIRIIENEERSS